MKGCKSIAEYKLRQFVTDNFDDNIERHYDADTQVITVKDYTGDKLSFKLIEGKVAEIEI